jgi:hypothetical protein
LNHYIILWFNNFIIFLLKCYLILIQINIY